MAQLYFKNGSSWVSLLNSLYPIGAVYISYTNTSPASFAGGTWSTITGRFPYFNSGTSTGGSNTHTMTTEELVQHSHFIHYEWSTGGTTAQKAPWGISLRNTSNSNQLVHDPTNGIQYSGESKPFSIMPAYQTFYAWRRTA